MWIKYQLVVSEKSCPKEIPMEEKAKAKAENHYPKSHSNEFWWTHRYLRKRSSFHQMASFEYALIKSFESAQITLSGIEIVQMIKENQRVNSGITPFISFCKLAGWFWFFLIMLAL